MWSSIVPNKITFQQDFPDHLFFMAFGRHMCSNLAIIKGIDIIN